MATSLTMDLGLYGDKNAMSLESTNILTQAPVGIQTCSLMNDDPAA